MIVWTTNVAASGSKVVIAGKEVSATTSSDGKTHTAWVTGLSPSTTYSFTVSSVYSGVMLTATGSGKTRMRITGWGTYDIAYSIKCISAQVSQYIKICILKFFIVLSRNYFAS